MKKFSPGLATKDFLRARSVVIFFASVALVVSSCAANESVETNAGQGADVIDVDELGASCSGVGDVAPASDFQAVARIYRVGSGDVLGAIDGVERDRPVLSRLLEAEPEVVFSDGSESLAVLYGNPADIASYERMPTDLPLLIATQVVDYPDRAELVKLAAVEQSDGSLVFVGDCAGRLYQEPLESYRQVAYPDLSPVELFLLVVSDSRVQVDYEDYFLGNGKYSATEFSTLEPRSRLLDLESTPEDVLAKLDTYEVLVELPSDWSELKDGAVCTFSPLGWNECVALELFDAGSHRLSVLANEGDRLEIWLVDYVDAGIDEPVALLGTTSPLKQADPVGALRVRLEDATLSQSLDDIRRGVTGGTVRLVEIED